MNNKYCLDQNHNAEKQKLQAKHFKNKTEHYICNTINNATIKNIIGYFALQGFVTPAHIY